MGEQIAEREALLFDPYRTTEAVSDAAAGGNVLAILTDSTSDEWHRQWERTPGASYEQMGIIETYELARSATAASPETQVVNPDLAVTTVQRPIELETLAELVDQYLDGWADSSSGTLVYVESIDTFLEGTDLNSLVGMVDQLLDSARNVDATVRVGIDTEGQSAQTTVRLCDRFETVYGSPLADAEAVAALERLRADDPTTFGYFRRHWRDALRALDASTRTYPQAKQLFEDATVREANPRMLGAALGALEQLGAIGLWGETVGANRYDLTNYDAEWAASLGIAVESLPN